MIRNLLTLTASVLVALLALELGLRAWDGVPLLSDANFVAQRLSLLRGNVAARYDPLLGWVHRPNVVLADRRDPFTTGELGVRMNQDAIEPVPRGAILATGDSFTVGSEVGNAETWPAQLQRLIGQPVVNAATGGWGSDQAIMRAEQLLPVLHPKAVIVSAIPNDMQRAEYETVFGGNKPYFTVEAGKPILHNVPVPESRGARSLGPLRAILGHSYLVEWAMLRLGATAWWQPPSLGYVKAPGVDGVAVTCALLNRLKAETDKAGARLLYVVEQGGAEVAAFPQAPTQGLETLACAAKAGIRTVDIWPRLKALSPEGLRALYNMRGQWFEHMNAKGNALVASEIAKALGASGE